jgi:hypothetical protein
MTKIKALITMLVLGTSAAAFAAPARSDDAAPTMRDHRDPMPAPAPITTTAPDVRDHREPLPQDKQMDRDSWKHRTQWTTLASSAKIIGTKEYVRVGAKAGKFDQLKLQTVSGKTQIRLVQINFANGQSQTVRLNTTLDRNNTVATVSLNGQHRAITSIVVYGAGNARSAYAILAA